MKITGSGHAWNAVKLDGKWYYLDATFDDPVLIGGNKGKDYVRYDYFLKGTKTFSANHILAGTKDTNTGKIYITGTDLALPQISTEDYNEL